MTKNEKNKMLEYYKNLLRIKYTLYPNLNNEYEKNYKTFNLHEVGYYESLMKNLKIDFIDFKNDCYIVFNSFVKEYTTALTCLEKFIKTKTGNRIIYDDIQISENIIDFNLFNEDADYANNLIAILKQTKNIDPLSRVYI